MPELEEKLARVRGALASAGLAALRLRGNDWFSWATCGGSAAVLLAAESGIAEALVTAGGAWVLTDVIEAARLREEELPAELAVEAGPWEWLERREAFVAERCDGGRVASDRPGPGEEPIPLAIRALRQRLVPEEVQRYRVLCREAAQAMTSVLAAAEPDWTGHRLAGAGMASLQERGIQPALVLVGDARRLPLHRHPTPSREPLGDRVMLVFCARRHGLYANLTRFAYFRAPDARERALARDVAEVEATAFAASRPGASLGDVFQAIARAYAARGHPGAEALHHQGGTCGYLSRDAVARPSSIERLAAGGAVAWNPSLPGAKIEDTVLLGEEGAHEVLTVDPAWPTLAVAGRRRPDLLVR